jgi:hypothetical protein
MEAEAAAALDDEAAAAEEADEEAADDAAAAAGAVAPALLPLPPLAAVLFPLPFFEDIAADSEHRTQVNRTAAEQRPRLCSPN